jgi:hypothetical protein
MRFHRILSSAILLSLSSTVSHAQFGVCDRAANDALFLVNNDANNRIAGIANSGFPPDVQNAQITIINYSRGDAQNNIAMTHSECMQGYRQPQSIVDTALNVYTFGINSRMGGAGHVDVSEILNGRPLGGPNALIPQAREQILQGNNGTIANTVRDPVGCLTFRHKC